MSMKKSYKQKQRRKRNKQIVTGGIATVLVAALGTVGILHHMEPMETYAKESFTGTKQIVESHTGDGNPFMILDVVPSYATYQWDEDTSYEISTGTLGYLVNGQSPMAADYTRIYEDLIKQHSADLSTYDKRAALVNEIWKCTDSETAGLFQYEEAYGGTRQQLNAADLHGWKLLISSETLSDEDKNKGETAQKGLMKGCFKKYEEPDASASASPDKTGYDYVKVGEWNESEGSVEASEETSVESSGETSSVTYKWDSNGTYQLQFRAVSGTGQTAGYVVKTTNAFAKQTAEEASSGYNGSTGLYKLNDDGNYVYVGTIDEIFPDNAASVENTTGSTTTGSTTTGSTTTGSTTAGSATTDSTTTDTNSAVTVVPDQKPEADSTASDSSSKEVTSVTVENKVNYAAYVPAVLYSELQKENAGGSVSDTTGDTSSSDTTGEATGDTSSDTTGDTPSDTTSETENSDSSVYYVVTFEYQASIAEDDTRTLYEISTVTEITDSSKPYDVYNRQGAEASSSATPVIADKVFLYVGAGQGDYKLTDQADLSEEDKKKQKPVWMEVRNAPTYFRFNGGCDWLKKDVFHTLSGGDNAQDNFNITVNTVRADQVTQVMIEKAGLVYLESGAAPFLNLQDNSKLTLSYLGEYTKTVTENGVTSTIGMTRNNAYYLVYQAAEDFLPVIVDYQAVTNDNEAYKGKDYQKLAKMFLKEDLETYVTDAQSDTEALFSRLEQSDYPNRSVNDNHYVNRNVYIVNSSTPLVSADFAVAFEGSGSQSGFAEVLALIASENSQLSDENKLAETVSKAKAIEYILNYSVGFLAECTDLRILELQPTNNSSSDLKFENPTDNSTTLYWQRNAQGAIKKQVIRSSRKMNVTVTSEAAAEFNSKWEDLNQNYNLVFIGLDGTKLNHGDSSLWSGTVYNDTDLTNKIYHTGDKAASDSSERYDASDITERKKNELLDFMRAGYPVLLENDFFKGKSAKNGVDYINTKYVAQDSQMYEFLKTAATDYRDRLYTVDDVRSNLQFLAQLSTNHPVITLADNADTSFSQRNGELYASFGYSITNQSGSSYDNCTASIYLDLNADGNYTDDERIDTAGGSVMQATVENGQVTVRFTESPGSRAIPFRMRVTDNNNSYLRASADGILTVTNGTEEKLRVLQIGANDAASLMQLYQNNNSTLGYSLKAAENTMKVEFEIATVDSATVAARLAKNPNYLNQWDLLILGFGNGAADISGIQNSITQYVSEGHSVLLTGQTLSGTKLDNTLLGLDAGGRKTYGKLGLDYGNDSSYRYRYAGLNQSMLGEQSGLNISGVNSGSISGYPHSVGSSATLSGNYQAYEPLLNLGGTQAPFVTPWYVFSKAGSDTNAFDISPNDGANNYYLYSRSNVVFIGNGNYAGYTYDAASTMPSGDGYNECRLFVNAMILAYDAGVHNLKVDMVAGFDQSAAKVTSISIPYDSDSQTDPESGLLDETTDVYFKFKNSNLTLSNTYAVKFYYEDPSGSVTLDTGEEQVRVTEFQSSLDTAEDNTLIQVSPAQLRQERVYRLKAPVKVLSGSAVNARIYVEVISTLDRPGCAGSRNATVRGCASVILNRTQLFLLE